jgi:ubiquinone/menaquinone biosynthesis C-methylase UbiE
MRPVDYDAVAPEYNRRYDTNEFDGIRATLRAFVAGATGITVEVGCGTGHWVADLAGSSAHPVVGLDPSLGMLRRARDAMPLALLVRSAAEALPFSDGSIARLYCVNALHHFQKPSAFAAECRRVLRPGGGVLTIGLDPHVGTDQWWVYDYFPTALEADRLRYPSSARISEWFAAEGFERMTTAVAQRIPAVEPFDVALERGRVERASTSQLLVITDEAYAAGRAQLLAERPPLRADLRLYASTAWRAV